MKLTNCFEKTLKTVLSLLVVAAALAQSAEAQRPLEDRIVVRHHTHVDFSDPAKPRGTNYDRAAITFRGLKITFPVQSKLILGGEDLFLQTDYARFRATIPGQAGHPQPKTISGTHFLPAFLSFPSTATHWQLGLDVMNGFQYEVVVVVDGQNIVVDGKPDPAKPYLYQNALRQNWGKENSFIVKSGHWIVPGMKDLSVLTESDDATLQPTDEANRFKLTNRRCESIGNLTDNKVTHGGTIYLVVFEPVMPNMRLDQIKGGLFTRAGERVRFPTRFAQLETKPRAAAVICLGYGRAGWTNPYFPTQQSIFEQLGAKAPVAE